MICQAAPISCADGIADSVHLDITHICYIRWNTGVIFSFHRIFNHTGVCSHAVDKHKITFVTLSTACAILFIYDMIAFTNKNMECAQDNKGMGSCSAINTLFVPGLYNIVLQCFGSILLF